MGKKIARFAIVLAVGALAVAPAADAYKIPKIPKGKAGGPPTTPKGGNSTSKSVTTKIATVIAGYTNTELAAGKWSIVFTFPAPATIKCTATAAGNNKLASGTATANKAGAKRALAMKFSASGKAFLTAHAGQATQIVVSCKVTPTSGPSATSTALLTTAK
ncbi:MAG: hypothetical protein ABSG43_04155 [Solirubrobacteraceae bacterium]|jgi:hypothetical protein